MPDTRTIQATKAHLLESTAGDPSEADILAAFCRRSLHDGYTLAVYLAHPEADESWFSPGSGKPTPPKSRVVAAHRSLCRLLNRGVLIKHGEGWFTQPSPYRSALESLRFWRANIRLNEIGILDHPYQSEPEPKPEPESMSLAVQQKKVINSLAALIPLASIVGAVRSLAADRPADDHRSALAEEAVRRLEAPCLTRPGVSSVDLSSESHDPTLNAEIDASVDECLECPCGGGPSDYLHPQRVWINWNGSITDIDGERTEVL